MNEPPDFHGFVLAISIVIALINCFYGYKMQRIWIGLICFFVGVIGGYALCSSVIEGVSTAIAVLVGIAFGALLALLSFRLYLVGVFLFAAGITFWACVLLFSGWPGIAIGVAAGLLVGFLAVKSTRIIMILTTGITGGLSAFKSCLLLVPVAAVHELVWLPFVGGGVLAVLGIMTQYRTDVRATRQKKAREDAKAARAAARQETAKLSPEIQAAAASIGHKAPAPLPLEESAPMQTMPAQTPTKQDDPAPPASPEHAE